MNEQKKLSEIEILENNIKRFNKESKDSIYAKDFFKSCFPNPKNESSIFILVTNKDLKSNIDYINACEILINLCMKTVVNDLNQDLINNNNVQVNEKESELDFNLKILSKSSNPKEKQLEKRYRSYQAANLLMSYINRLSKVVDISDELKNLILKNKEIVNQKKKLFEKQPSIALTLKKMDSMSNFIKSKKDSKLSMTNQEKNTSEGCYIATMVYGNYNHSQVKELRKFRDNILIPNTIGKIFVKIYYRISPKLVEKLKNRKNIHSYLKLILDQLVKLIK